MFVKGIEIAKGYTRCIKTIMRSYGSNEIMRGCGSCIIVNDEGWLLTCKHIVEGLLKVEGPINSKYDCFKQERNLIKALPKGKQKKELEKLEQKYGYSKTAAPTVQLKNLFIGVFNGRVSVKFIVHPTYDLALVKLNGFNDLTCNNYPLFKDATTNLKQGMSLCRLGFPFAEFTDYQYDAQSDCLDWIGTGGAESPCFPIDGILTRFVNDNNGVYGIEMSTPGLIGQSGAPLFDKEGVVCGMQFATHSEPLGFDQVNREIIVNRKKKKVSDHPFMHLGRCIHVDVIKRFMDENGVKYQKG